MSEYRSSITKVRGGWTKDKIKKELKNMSGSSGDIIFYREIAKYETPEDFAKNLFYHGSGTFISNLKPSIVLNNTSDFGGGSGDKYYGISLSKEKDIASNFTGISSTGCVAPVLLMKDAKVKEIPEISDANELEDIIVDLWNEGIDAVIIGDHTCSFSEQEIVILNPKCIVAGKPESFKVFNKPKMPSLNKDELTEIWLDSSNRYKNAALKSWDEHNVIFKNKYGRDKDIKSRWSLKQEQVFQNHLENVLKYQENKKIVEFIKNKDKKEKKSSSRLKIK